MLFNTNKSSFSSTLYHLKKDFYAFADASVRKGKSSKQSKRGLKLTVSAAIDSIDTDDFGVHAIIVKAVQ